MSLKLNGKDERLRRADFIAVAGLAGLRAGDANETIDALVQAMRVALDRIVVPPQGLYGPNAAPIVARALELSRARVKSFERLPVKQTSI
jgi:serine/threonine-protein kinase HipA